MNLRKKKELAARTLDVGKNRIAFANSRINEIKEAITKQDIRDLLKEGAIIIKNIQGRQKVSGKMNRGKGNVKKQLNTRKKEYIMLTRKLRRYLKDAEMQGKLKSEQIEDLRKKIRNKYFKSKSHLKEYTGGIKNETIQKKKKRM